MPNTSLSAAKRLCELSGWQISQLKLQKMLYLADMVYVGANGCSMFDENYEAWDYGPVLPSVYQKTKAFGAKPIPNVFHTIDDLPEDMAPYIENAWESLRGQSPGELVANTHWEHGAWAKVYKPGVKGITLKLADIINEYEKRTGSAA